MSLLLSAEVPDKVREVGLLAELEEEAREVLAQVQRVERVGGHVRVLVVLVVGSERCKKENGALLKAPLEAQSRFPYPAR